ncbi:MAG TPA: glucose 1-dehydrogenase [Syntrophomonadaceae bacterium]|nr:glucose 1-dehydrogenase [Syntrophomonadaceae bacterium]
MEISFRLDDKVAIVTGAGRGLGEAMAKGLAMAGAKLVITDIDYAAAQKVATDIQAQGSEALAVEVDVTNSMSVEKMVNQVLSRWERIDILVNNAGINRRGSCVDMLEEDWQAVIDVNLKGAFLCCKMIGKVMLKQQQGKIINITSLLGTVAQPNRGPYAASKGGLVQLTKVLALEWAKSGINVNGLCPGYFLTELNAALMDDKEVFAELTSRIPMGRWGQPDELLGSLLFLASDASNYITGQVLYVDGGYLCM